jgi:CRP/FNR family transcriptional regulator, cyclic AMP receptor protein
MSQSGIINCFASHQFLQRLDDRCRLELMTGVRPFAAEPGDYLGRAGEPANAFYLVQSGEIEVGVEDGEDFHTVFRVGPGGALGWSWLVPPNRWQFTSRATEPVRGLEFNAEWLRERCEQNHELGYYLLRELVAAVTQQFSATWQEATRTTVV